MCVFPLSCHLAVIICRVNTALQQLAVNQNWAFTAKQLHPVCWKRSRIGTHSLSIKCPCHLKVQRVAAGRPRPPSCLWDVTTAPPRRGAGGCRGSGRTGGGGGCRPTGTTGDSREPPEPTGAGWVPGRSRRGGAAPSCRRPPPRRRGGRQEVRPPSGPAGLRSDGCWDGERGLLHVEGAGMNLLTWIIYIKYKLIFLKSFLLPV